MCGIAVCISRNNNKIDEEALRHAGKIMIHRGPDAQGIFSAGWVGMIHNRLSIIDLSEKANQPMFSRDGRYAIVYNGEIYNYRELRSELEQDGVEFLTSSDTEVLLNLYIRSGKGCLMRLRGMFAFAVVDLRNKEVFAARDHFGIKPVYLHVSGERIIISSEIKPLSAFIGLRPNYDKQYEDIMFRCIAGPHTSFKDIDVLEPGCSLLYRQDDDSLVNEIYFRIEETFQSEAKFGRMSEGDILSEGERILIESIKAHTLSDVGYNVQLSGGLDSGLIAGILVRRLNRADVNTFSLAVEDDRCNESPYQDIVRQALGFKNYRVDMSNKIFADNFERATLSLERPVYHYGSVCLYYLTRHSVLDSKVILTGEGADEAFGGYDRYRIPFRRKAFRMARKLGIHRIASPIWNGLEALGNFVYPLKDALDKTYSYYLKLKKDPLISHDASFYGWLEIERLIEKNALLNQDLSYREGLLLNAPKDDVRTKMLYYTQLTHMVALLDRQDKVSMANSVEARVPFVDLEVFRFANSIPLCIKFGGGHLKYVLKKIAEKYLPPEIVYRRKNGLILPIDKWLKDKHGFGRYIDILLDNATKKRGIYNTKYIERLIKLEREKGGAFSKRLAALIAFEVWHRMFFDNGRM